MNGPEQNPAVLDQKPDPLPPRSWQRLETAGDCRRFFRWLVLEVKRGRMDLKKANTLAFIGGHLLRAVETADLENRICAIEAEQDGQTDPTIRITVTGRDDHDDAA